MTIRWRSAWAMAQITPVLFSTLVWILVLGWSLPASVGLAALGLLYVAARNTALGLWWRFGARRVLGAERDRMLAALVPIESLRGRSQPVVWRGSRLAGQPMVVPTSRDLVIASSLVTRVSAGRCGEREFCRAVSAALALRPVDASAAVAIINVYSAPWALLQLVTVPFKRALTRVPLFSLAWKVRWVVFAAALVTSAQDGRWDGFAGVSAITALSWSTPRLEAAWVRVAGRLADAGPTGAVSAQRRPIAGGLARCVPRQREGLG